MISRTNDIVPGMMIRVIDPGSFNLVVSVLTRQVPSRTPGACPCTLKDILFVDNDTCTLEWFVTLPYSRYEAIDV